MFSVIVPLLNNVKFTKKFIDSFYKTVDEIDYELIFIDNNSYDSTPDFLKKCKSRDDRIKTITNPKNVGVSASWNQGIKESTKDYICICNNDIEFLSMSWLSKLKNKTSNKIFWVTPRTCYTKDFKKISYKITHYEQLRYGNNPNMYVVGCCFMLPRKCIEEIGLFDEQFEMKYYEDLDYINRILKSGYKVTMCPEVIIYHAVGATSRITPGGGNNKSYYDSKWGNSRFNILEMQKNTKKTGRKA